MADEAMEEMVEQAYHTFSAEEQRRIDESMAQGGLLSNPRARAGGSALVEKQHIRRIQPSPLHPSSGCRHAHPISLNLNLQAAW